MRAEVSKYGGGGVASKAYYIWTCFIGRKRSLERNYLPGGERFAVRTVIRRTEDHRRREVMVYYGRFKFMDDSKKRKLIVEAITVDGFQSGWNRHTLFLHLKYGNGKILTNENLKDT